MKVLSKEELKKAEEALRNFFPQSLQAYGYVFMMNRVKADPIDVLVDHWPDFNKYQQGVDLCHTELINSLAVSRGVPNIRNSERKLMTLQDLSKLKPERFPLQVSSLNESHLDLINSTWKFGSDEFSKRFIRGMILNFPSCCVLDSDGQPVSWILTYASFEIGMLYTLPEHRRKGYAKALATILAKKLHSEGYPVYCLIDVHNQPSYRLCTSLGFVNDPSYVTARIECDPNSITP